MTGRFLGAIGTAGAWFVLTIAALAQTPAPASRFDISGYSVEGAPLLKSEDFSRIITPFIGKQKSAADVQKAHQTLQQAYRDLGHCAVQVTIPKNEPDAGVITFRLLQAAAPFNKDCLPMVVLDEKRAPSLPVAPGSVAVQPFMDVTRSTPGEQARATESRLDVARAPVKPLQDRPLTASPAAPKPEPPPVTPTLAAAPAPAEVVKPLVEPLKPVVVSSVPATPTEPVKPAVTVMAIAPAKPAAVVADLPAPSAPPFPSAAPAPSVVVAKPQPKPLPLKPEVLSGPLVAQGTPVAPATLPVPKPAPKPVPVVVDKPAPAPLAAPVAVDTALSAPLRFDISRYRVEGNTLLTPGTINAALARYIGRQKDFGDVQRALESLQNAYQEIGYGAVQVTLPEQELERGEVRFEVIETRIGKIDVQGNEHYNEQNIRRSLPGLKEGETPNSLAIARNLRVGNEIPTKQVQVMLRAGSKDGEVDATVKVVDDNPLKRSISFDNTGTSNTGRFRLGLGFQHANMFNLDHMLTFQYITNPEHPSDVTVFGLGYRIPLYDRGDSIDFFAGYSNVDSGTVQQLFNVSGAGAIYGARYNLNLDRVGNYEHKIVFGADYRAFKNDVTFVGSTQPLVPDLTIHPLSITYNGLWRGEKSELSFYGSWAQNIFPGGNDAAPSDIETARAGAKAAYQIYRFGATYTRLVFDGWQGRVAVAAQQTSNLLVAGEQFGLGGADSIRGFDERQFSNDKGYRANLELYTPDVAGKLGWTGVRLRFLAFYDAGNLTRIHPQPGEQLGLALDSIGIGLRMSTRENFSLKLDYAQVLHDGGVTAGLPNGRRNSNTLHAAVIWVF